MLNKFNTLINLSFLFYSMFLDINPIQGYKRSGKYPKVTRDAEAVKLIENVVGFSSNL